MQTKLHEDKIGPDQLPVDGNTYKKLNRAMSKAIHCYDMISAKDRILVAVSGGKDSLTLLWMLEERLRRIPITYDLYPVHVDPGFDRDFSRKLADYCNDLHLNLRVEHTDFGIAAHSSENRENPCFLCALRRRKRLFEIADELGCNKVALGHNKDDIIETVFINMFYAGEISTMVPAQPFFNGRFTVIRPLAFADEKLIRRFGEERNFPNLENPCPSAFMSRRSDVKNLLSGLYKTNKKIKGNIFRSLSHVKPEYLLKRA
jgi:tRNA 2-thiocytidine biosynthesis protein TtcA